MPNSSRADLLQAFPSSAVLPATNPTAMHQFPKPRHNKLSTSAARHKRASEAGGSSSSFFAKLSGFGNHSNGLGHSRRSSDEEMTVTANGPSMYTPLDWACIGDDNELDWGVLAEPTLRPPSLTHSRGSSSDSAVSSTSSAFDHKPLPALPVFLTPDNKGRPFSVAVHESIDQLNSLAISRQNSQESARTPAQLHFPHLDLAVLNPAAPSHASPSVASSSTPKRPASTFTAFSASSPATIWTPRDSTCYTPGLSAEDDSTLSPFGLEASLARQELLAKAQSNVILLSEQLSGTLPNCSEIPEEEEEDFGEIESNVLSDVFADFEVRAEPNSTDFEAETDVQVECEADEGFVTPVDEDMEDPSLLPGNAVRRATIKNRGSARLSISGGGWRNWRAGSQPNTPSAEVPPQLSLQLPCGAVGSLLTGTPGTESSMANAPIDYFGSALASSLNSIPENAGSSPSTSPTVSLTPFNTDNAVPSGLPKLSPEFTFGRRSPSPTPSDKAVEEETMYGNPSPLRFSRQLPPSQVPMPLHRRSRAASADHLGPQLRALAASAGPSSASQSSTAMHKSKLALRKAGTAPRLQARSFDAEELKLLREMSTPKYTWI